MDLDVAEPAAGEGVDDAVVTSVRQADEDDGQGETADHAQAREQASAASAGICCERPS